MFQNPCDRRTLDWWFHLAPELIESKWGARPEPPNPGSPPIGETPIDWRFGARFEIGFDPWLLWLVGLYPVLAFWGIQPPKVLAPCVLSCTFLIAICFFFGVGWKGTQPLGGICLVFRQILVASFRPNTNSRLKVMAPGQAAMSIPVARLLWVSL